MPRRIIGDANRCDRFPSPTSRLNGILVDGVTTMQKEQACPTRIPVASQTLPRFSRKRKPQSVTAISLAGIRRATGSVATPDLCAKQHLGVAMLKISSPVSPGIETSSGGSIATIWPAHL